MTKPSKEYTIHILENEDFDMLPIGNPKEALGMTDPERKVAWVRRTHVKDLDMGTIHHEFDELMAGTSLHEENGIRYKKLKNFFRSIVPLLLNFVPVIGPALSLASGVGAAASASSDAAKQQKKSQAEANSFFAGQQQQQSSAFAPAPAEGAPAGPLSDVDFKSGLANIDTNREQRLSGIGRLFRGQTREGNTQFGKQAASTEANALSNREDFIKRQDEAKRVGGIF